MVDHATLIRTIDKSEIRDKNNIFIVDPVSEKESDLWYTCNLNEATKIRWDGPGVMNKFPPQTMHSAFAQTAQKYGNIKALNYKYKHNEKFRSLTYSQFYHLSCQVAKSFIKVGLEERNSVCISGFNSVPWVVSFHGCIFANGVVCGSYTTNSLDIIKYIMNNCNCQIAVVETEELLDRYLEAASECPRLLAIIQFHGTIPTEKKFNNKIAIYDWLDFMALGTAISDKELHNRLKHLIPNECCSLIYTSGTTGNPKGVMMSHDNLIWTSNILKVAMAFRMGKEGIVSYLPLSHVAAQLCDILIPLTIAATVSFAQADALKGTLGVTLKQIRPTYFIGVPRVYEKIMEKMKATGSNASCLKKKLAAWAKNVGLKATLSRMKGKNSPSANPVCYLLAKVLVYRTVKGRLGLDRCRGMFSAAAPISIDTLHYFGSLDMVVCEIYGLSECSGPQTVGKHKTFKYGSVGQVLSEVTMKVGSGKDTEGEVSVNGRHVFMGYVGAEDKTREVFDENNYLLTGDIGVIDDEGYLYITGRIKELLITAGGENIAPVPIEDKIKSALPIISNAIVIGDQLKFLSVLLTLKCVMNEEKEIPTDQLAPSVIEWCRTFNYFPNQNLVSQFIKDKNPEIWKTIDDAIQNVNKSSVSRAAVIQKWVFLPEDLSVGNEELGPTLKMKRRIVTKKYESLINDLYKE